MCEQVCYILERFSHLDMDSIIYFCNKLNVKTRKVTLCCSSEKHQPNLIIWSRLDYFVACSRIFHFQKGVCRYITHGRMLK